MLLKKLIDKKLIHPPKWLASNTQYMTIMGSNAYGTATEDSDFDIYGFSIPKRVDIFPHLKGEILGFGEQTQRFNVWQEHHVCDKEEKKEYDFAIYSIISYFNLLMQNNPNIIDGIFTPINCVIHCTAIGQMVRDNRKMFLHKGCWHKFRGYSYSQLSKMVSKNPEGKRKEIVDRYG